MKVCPFFRSLQAYPLLVAAIIETQNLSKSFRSFRAVDDLSFMISSGEVYGFLGQNGAGKSTTMRMLLGLVRPSSGRVFIRGTEFHAGNVHLLRHIGAVIERPDLYGYLSGWDNLRIFAGLSGGHLKKERLMHVLELVELKGRERDKVKTYSQGMKQRLGIAIALAHSPDLLILDEPTNGLDPQGIADMRRLITHLSREHGKTILISSHLLGEIEQVATSMLIIHKGRKVVEGSVRQLLHPDETLTEIRVGVRDNILPVFSHSEWKRHIHHAEAGKLVFRMNPAGIPALNGFLVASNIPVLEIISRHSLEAYFLKLTNDPGH